MKKAVKIIMIIFILAALAVAAAAAFCHWKERKYSETVVPANLSATSTVQRYFEYWNAGNNCRMRQLTLNGQSLVGSETDNFIPSLYFFVSIECTQSVLLDEKARNYDDYYDNAIVTASFTYKSTPGFGDERFDRENTGWNFYLVKETESSPWRIISWEHE